MRGKRMASAGFVARRTGEPFEGDFEHQALVLAGGDFAHRAETVRRMIADIAVEFDELLVGEAEIGLADRHQLVA